MKGRAAPFFSAYRKKGKVVGLGKKKLIKNSPTRKYRTLGFHQFLQHRIKKEEPPPHQKRYGTLVGFHQFWTHDQNEKPFPSPNIGLWGFTSVEHRINKKVLLLECERHATRRIAAVSTDLLTGVGGGYPIQSCQGEVLPSSLDKGVVPHPVPMGEEGTPIPS